MGEDQAQQATDHSTRDGTFREQESLGVTVPIVHSTEGGARPNTNGEEAAEHSPSYAADECTSPLAGLPHPNRVNFTQRHACQRRIAEADRGTRDGGEGALYSTETSGVHLYPRSVEDWCECSNRRLPYRIR